MTTYDSLVESVQSVADVSIEDAQRYVNLLRDHKVLRYLPGGGCRLEHGMFMERDTILHTLSVWSVVDGAQQ